MNGRSLLRRAHLRVAASRLGRVCDVRVVAHVTDAWYSTTVDDVLATLDALSDADVTAWLAGGWGVDALVGHQTRPHTDLDVMIEATPSAVDAATRALVGRGLRRVTERPASGPMPGRILFADLTGRSADLLPVATGAGGGEPPFVTGTLGGRAVACLSAAEQLRLHEGIPLSRSARADVAALRRVQARGSRSPFSPPRAAPDRPG